MPQDANPGAREMRLPDAILVSALAAAGLCGFLLVHFRAFRGRLAINPRYRDLLAQHGLTAPKDFLALSGVIVSGHPDRHVMQLTLGDGPTAVAAFLKREHRVPWRDRLWHAWFGLGWVSKSV